MCNSTPNSQYLWSPRPDFFRDQVTAADAPFDDEDDDDEEEAKSMPLREKNRRNARCSTHVPHRDKPPQIVARRNARERRRVQAVNSAFMRLRKAVPFENHRGKRISKVKTLKNAIEYIQNLQDLLTREGYYEAYSIGRNYPYHTQQNDLADHLSFTEDFVCGKFY